MSRCYFVVSLKRSGHHAFIDWFARAHNGPIAFFNNVYPTNPITVRHYPYYYGNHPHLLGNNPLASFAASPHETIINFEGRLAELVEGSCRANVEEQFGKSVKSIYFLRDPLNCFASLMKRVKEMNNRSYLRIFSQIAGFESIVNWIAAHGLSDQLVTFSGWRFDDDVRAAIAERLDVENLRPPQRTSKFGGGSSFLRDQFGHAAEPDELLSRWRLMIDEPTFLAVFRDPITQENFRRYFALAGDREIVNASALETVIEAANASEEAAFIHKEKLEPFRQRLPLIHKLQSASTRTQRELLLFRIQVATGLLLHRS